MNRHGAAESAPLVAPALPAGVRPATYLVVGAGPPQTVEGAIVEEALACISVNGQELATFMCTPYELDRMALGFLYNEGLIESADAVRALHVSRSSSCVDVWLHDTTVELPNRQIVTAGCGGGVTFDDLSERHEPLHSDLRATPQQLADIAVASCRARRRVVGDEPRVAFLSYSTKGSARGPMIDKMVEGLRLFRLKMPDVPADGELQGDAALVPGVGDRKAPGSPVAGRANVLVFPDLDAGNIAYKLVQRVGGAEAIGPIVQGLDRPCNDLSRGADPSDIVEVACIASLMAS